MFGFYRVAAVSPRTVVADAAHSLGARRRGVNAGQAAELTAFSFHAVKNLTTAEGGALTWRPDALDDDDAYKQVMLMSLHGQTKDALAKDRAGAWEYDILGPWCKCNMTDVAAAIGLRQLDRYPSLLARRTEILSRYDACCDALGLSHLRHHTPVMDSSNHLCLVRVPGFAPDQRNALIERLAQAGVSSNVHYKPLPLLSAYRSLGWDIAAFPNAFAYYANLLSLPLHTRLSNDDVDYVCDALQSALAPC